MATPLSVLACPSDDLPSPPIVHDRGHGFSFGIESHTTDNSADFGMTSYRGNTTAIPEPSNNYVIGNDGVITLSNLSQYSQFASVGGTSTPVTILGITDGTTNTIMFGEISNAPPLNYSVVNPPPSSPVYSLLINSCWLPSFRNAGFPLYGCGSNPLNYQLQVNMKSFAAFNLYLNPAYGSSHPGGANFVFCDGSVHFISNSINNAGTVPTSLVGYGNVAFTPITLLQALCTRAGGEVVDPSQY